MSAPVHHRADADPGMRFVPFVALMASLMALNAIGIDCMLPALPAIGRTIGIVRENDRQWIVSIYMIGFGLAQLFYGPIADRYGRRPLLTVSTFIVALCAVVAGLSNSFPTMLAARFLQGVASAASRVLVISIVRDCYSGRQMARVMSLALMVFLAVPVLAPTIGQLILAFASWRFIFFALTGYALCVSLVATRNLKETLRPEHRRPISPGSIVAAMRIVIATPVSIGYTIAGALAFGCMMGFINSVQQIFEDTFHRPALFPAVFAAAAAAIAVAAFLNSRIVERYGPRRVSQMALFGFILGSAVHVAIAYAGRETIATFAVLQALTMFSFGMMGANFGSMAMEPVAAIAGTASSVQGFLSTVGAAVIGILIGQSFDGTTRPLALGFLLAGLATLATVTAVERARTRQPVLT